MTTSDDDGIVEDWATRQTHVMSLSILDAQDQAVDAIGEKAAATIDDAVASCLASARSAHPHIREAAVRTIVAGCVGYALGRLISGIPPEDRPDLIVLAVVAAAFPEARMTIRPGPASASDNPDTDGTEDAP